MANLLNTHSISKSDILSTIGFIEKGLFFMNDVDISAKASILANNARKEILKMTSAAKASHVASSLSVIDALSVLYSGGANISIENLNKHDRDIVILSKGHAAAAIYSVLALKGFFDIRWLEKYCQDGEPLGGHVTSKNVPGVELSTGSLGHGLPYGLGIAMAKKRSNIAGKIYVVMSDGECDEGTTWESALIANHFALDNLCVIIDRNRIQSLTFTEDTIALEPFAKKWDAFGWQVVEVDGHDHSGLARSILKKSDKPKCIIANTTKGKGIDFMENTVLWHYKSPNSEELNQALNQLEDKI
jgi:transketolase